MSGIALEVESRRAQLDAEQAERVAVAAHARWRAERSPASAVSLDEANAWLAQQQARAFRIAEQLVARRAAARVERPEQPLQQPAVTPGVRELTLW